MILKKVTVPFVFALSLGVASAAFAGGSDVYINGQQLTVQQKNNLQKALGTYIAPGSYLVDANTGCWYNQSSGAGGCPSGSNAYNSRYGSGSYDNSGNWNHWSNAAGGGVGGTSDGCIYTTYGWSNC
ncbi:hypothetical protein [Thiosocius teredinicola]|uniref:hypothetical protein n=1 Tax=Thiosocius teredinicola TaxID=1973002 RepID=UPI000990E219